MFSDQNELQKLQKNLLEIASTIHDICEENGIKYFMLGGTFIGAVRHKGFIPWDDDIDFGMDRENYEKFLNIISSKLPSNYRLQYYKNQVDEVFWIKIENLDYKIIQKIDNIQTEKYLYIDIFPFDHVPDNPIQRTIFKYRIYFKALKMRLAKMLFLCNTTQQTFAKKSKRIMVRFLKLKIFSKYLDYAKVLEQYENLISQYKNKETSLIANFSVNHQLSKIYRELFYKSKIEELADYDFENIQLKGIKNYDYLLSQTFGDYMQLPPKEEQVAKHFVKIVSIKEREEVLT